MSRSGVVEPKCKQDTGGLAKINDKHTKLTGQQTDINSGVTKNTENMEVDRIQCQDNDKHRDVDINTDADETQTPAKHHRCGEQWMSTRGAGP